MMDNEEFKALVLQKGTELYRDMPWRQDTQAYYVMVSEIMLQQTQVERVVPKFTAFIVAFPTVEMLAAAPLAEVLGLWSGLGYNRRAKYLHDSAKQIALRGTFPETAKDLQTLPGIGKNTAGAIMAYSFNIPSIFIETNIRTVYLHHFFPGGEIIADKQIEQLLDQTIEREHPREFYWALMDYGSWLKRQGAGNIRQSKHYKKQSPLKGSVREVRGAIVKQLTHVDMTEVELRQHVFADERFAPALAGLVRDGLVAQKNDKLHLTK